MLTPIGEDLRAEGFDLENVSTKAYSHMLVDFLTHADAL